MRSSSAWSEQVMQAGWQAGDGIVPKYGSLEFLELHQDDARFMASVVIAADCWWWEGLPEVIAERLANEMLDSDLLVLRRIRGASWDVSSAADWRKVANHRRPLPALSSP